MHESPFHPGHASTPSRPRALGPFARAAVLVFLAFVTIAAAPRQLRVPRDPETIKKFVAAGPHAGECDRCHSMHSADQPNAYPNALVGPNDNAFCLVCHDEPWTTGSFAGEKLYLATGHGSSTTMIWPGPDPGMRVEIDAPTKCLNCHDPHGWSDVLGEIPHLALQREEKLCLACHDGSPAHTNIAAELAKPYRHPGTTYTGRHADASESLPADFGISPLNNRHAECEDCHNPHVSRQDRTSVEGTSAMSRLNFGVSRVAVSNGAAGARPLYQWLAASDSLAGPNAEYELCFKCHSSWTTQPVGQTDFAVVLNPANPSYHPVEDLGRNLNIAAAAFTPGWSSTSITRCGSCHGSDLSGTSGPHGSTNAGLLRRPYPVGSGSRMTNSDELCFECHSYDVYANPNSSPATLAASRFNAPGVDKGHAVHVGEEDVPCYACHVTHGSSTQPNLLVTGRVPGLVTYTRTSNGGSCTATCHDPQSYTANYAR